MEETKQKFQLFLILAILLVAARTGYVLYQRHENNATPAKKEAPPLDADDYVVPMQLHAYDLKSSRQLMQQPVWVKVGYSITIYPYDASRHHVDFSRDAGKLLPIEKLNIKDVISAVSPEAPDQKQMMAVFSKDGKDYAFSFGSEKDGDYQIFADDMLFIQDPHDLYKHWSADTWQAIDQHQLKNGMNQLQADFAVGLGYPQDSGDSNVRIVNYPNGGKPLTVTFTNKKITEIKPGSAT